MIKIILYLVIMPFVIIGCVGLKEKNVKVKSYGNLTKMMHLKKTEGVINLQKAIPPVNGYAVGAIQNGKGEITVVNSNVWLDYGKDGIGKAVNKIPPNVKAVILATVKVSKWQTVKIEKTLTKEELYKFIIEKARQDGLDINAPFPFLLEGYFKLSIHVIDGLNSNPDVHTLYKHITDLRYNQKAVVIGFYSAGTQGVFTHPGKSWHLHAVIEKDDIGAHVNDLTVQKNTILKLPVVNN
jgi:hypothetical protein